MPTLIPRDEALRRIYAEGRAPACLMCAIVERRVGDVHAVFEDDDMLVMLPRYVRRWGQVMVTLKRHVCRFDEVDAARWTRASQLAHQAARMVERVMRPRRCYLASTGSSAGELLQSSQHHPLHVIPRHEPDDKPSEIFSWEAGVLVAEPDEWRALLARFQEVWPACWP